MENKFKFESKHGLDKYWLIVMSENAYADNAVWEEKFSPFRTQKDAEDFLEFLKRIKKPDYQFLIVEVNKPIEYQRVCTPEWYENGYEIRKVYFGNSEIAKYKVMDFSHTEELALVLLEKIKNFFAHQKDDTSERSYLDENGLYFFDIEEINPDYTEGNLRDILNGLNDKQQEVQVLAYIHRLQNEFDKLKADLNVDDEVEKNTDQIVIDNLKEQIDLLKKELAAANDKNKDLSSQLSNAADHIQQNSKEPKSNEIEVMKAKVQKYADENADLKKQLSEKYNKCDEAKILSLEKELENAQAKYNLKMEELTLKLRETEQQANIYAEKAQEFAEARLSDLTESNKPGNKLMQLLARDKRLAFEVDENQIYQWTAFSVSDESRLEAQYKIGKKADMIYWANKQEDVWFVPASIFPFNSTGEKAFNSAKSGLLKPEYFDMELQAIHF